MGLLGMWLERTTSDPTAAAVTRFLVAAAFGGTVLTALILGFANASTTVGALMGESVGSGLDGALENTDESYHHNYFIHIHTWAHQNLATENFPFPLRCLHREAYARAAQVSHPAP